MSYQKAALRLAIFPLVLTAASLSGFSQDPRQSQGQDPMEKPRNVKPELKKAYKDWLEKDVTYVITDEERKAFKKLQTDDERERFIEEFWRRRDPDPDTDENEFKEEYYERIAYANEHFASGIPGWKSDRGRIWIMFGKPDERETHPSGGNYDRPSYEGGGSTSTYPFETWFYRYLPGVGSGIEIEFVDPTGSGEYRIARSPNEKDALLNVPGAGLTLSEELGLSNKGDRISGMGSVGDNNYQREQDSPFSRLQLLADLSRPPQVKFNDLASAVNTGVIEENPLNFDVRVDFFRQSDERVITAITIQAENKDLVFEDSGGLLQARMNIFGRITSVAGRRAGIFEDPVITTATSEELTDAKERKSAYQKAVPLVPGTYKVDVIVRDVTSGATGVRHVGFTVPRYDPQKLSTSTLVLAAKLESLVDQPAVGQFVIGQTKVIPNVSGVYRRGQPVGVYLQVYNAGIDQTTLRPSVDVEYALLKDGKELGKQVEDWRGLSDSGQRLTLARLIDTRQLAPGEYEIAIRIRDHVSGQSLAPSAKFTVAQ
ncbi:MAG TPA: GWxTD domain-containing protein [Blastocatellia bacterium]|jgi:GWxTD domain-containing protein|nr:GWxTD domain-containing protein [Blastocatellia bacterium]HAF22282.1 GWxTD domain-containing protein [Blastocatellia bacterium]HCX31034.1 GWxTD domain-containing protein [Blastocatellia bacterium]